MTRFVVVLIGLLVAGNIAGAQSADTALKPMTPFKFAWQDTARVADSTHARTARVEPADRKDPTTAGWLSFAWPGVGSYYAGANGHGTIHLAVSLVSLYGVVVGASNRCVVTRFDSCSSGSGQSNAIVGASLVVGLTNAVWSIFTAAADARDHNDGDAPAIHVATELHFDPTSRSVGVQLLTWRF